CPALNGPKQEGAGIDPAGHWPPPQVRSHLRGRPLLVAIVLERDPEPNPKVQDTAVLDGQVLTHDLGHAQLAYARGRGLNRHASRGLPGLATYADNLGDPVDAIRHANLLNGIKPDHASLSLHVTRVGMSSGVLHFSGWLLDEFSAARRSAAPR